jgi:beta-lactamase class C
MMINKIKLLLTLWVVLSCSYAAFGIEDLSIILEQFEKELLEVSKKKKIPGFAVGIVQQNQIVYLKGFGVQNLRTKHLITPYTIFQIASISKPIAGTLMTMLHMQKLLSLEDPVVQYMPHFTLEAGKLKVRHLLTHTSGLPRQGFNQFIESKNYSRADIIYQLKKTKVIGPPGSYFDYHNASFSLLEEVIESATQQGFSSNLRDRLLIPLGMNRTTLSYEELQQETDKAHPHVINDQGKLVPCKTYSQGYYKAISAGGINSCVADMCQFMIAQLGYKPEVISQEVLTFLHQPFIQAPDFFIKFRETSKRFKSSYYGLGWRILDYENHRLLFHGGLLKGFVNVLILLPEQGIGIIILQNCERPFAWRMAMGFVDRILGLPAKVWG